MKLLAELPSVRGQFDDDFKPSILRNPYTNPKRTTTHMRTHRTQIIQDVTECCARTKNIIQESHKLGRKKASEILTFLLSDTDREKSKHGIDNIPIAYALKGYSLNT